MSDTPRICVLTSGQDRVHQTSTHIFKAQIPYAECDFYALFWKPVTNANLQEYVKGFRSTTIWTAEPREFDDMGNVFKAPETKTKNFLSMIWGRGLLGTLMNDNNLWEKYDIFLFCRTDVCFDSMLDLHALAAPLQQDYDLLLTKNGHHRGGFNDQTCIANAHGMKIYLGLYDKLVEYLMKGVLLHPETLLKHHLIEHGLRIATLPTQNFLFRDDATFNLG